MKRTLFCLLLAFALCTIANARRECVPRVLTGNNGIVCVCNMTYCDDLDLLKHEPAGVVTLFESNKHGDRFKESKSKFGTMESHPHALQQTITIDRSKKYQEILGFGGAFTDAAGINMASLPNNMANNIIKDYFSVYGLEYSMGRIPIAGTDFSTRPYSYDDHAGDKNLTQFSLVEDDYLHKIPFIHLAQKMSPHQIKLFGSPWSSPAWMKNNSQFNHGGVLIGQPGGEYYQIWANYFVKFLDAYKDNGVHLWGITVENEPQFGFHSNYAFNCLGFTPEMERDFIKLNLGPTLEKHGYGPKNLKMMIMDDNRDHMVEWADTVFNDKDTAKYVSGIAYHWYSHGPISVVEKTHEKHPQFFIINSEASQSFSKGTIGDWTIGENYALDIMTDLQHWTQAWIDWNLALDMGGGPNWSHGYYHSPIMINASAHEYYKQSMFYVMGHYSKFLTPGSVKIDVTQEPHVNKLETIAFERPDKSIVLIIINLNDDPISLTLSETTHGRMTANISPHAIQSYIWN